MVVPDMGSQISTDEACRRIDAIAPLLLWDVRRLLETRAVMEAGNQLVIQHGLLVGEAAETYNIIQTRLAMMLALDLARVLDVSVGRSKDKQDKASVPILAHHLDRPDVRGRLAKRAEDGIAWFAGVNEQACVDAIDEALELNRNIYADPVGATAIERVRELRTQRLAHSLYDADPARPFYSDLFLLADFARDFVGRVSQAIMAGDRDMSGPELRAMQSAQRFWSGALAGHHLQAAPR